MPPHLGQRRVKAIRVGLSAKTKLHMGKQRGWEEDEIFHRKMEMKGEDGDGVVLDPGNQVWVIHTTRAKTSYGIDQCIDSHSPYSCPIPYPCMIGSRQPSAA